MAWKMKVSWAWFLFCVRNYVRRQKYTGPMWWRTLAYKIERATNEFGHNRAKPTGIQPWRAKRGAFDPINIDDEILDEKTRKSILEFAIYGEDEQESVAARDTWARLFPNDPLPENPEWSVRSAAEKAARRRAEA